MELPGVTFKLMNQHMNEIAKRQSDFTAVEIIEILKTYTSEFEKSVLVFGKDIKISPMEASHEQ